MPSFMFGFIVAMIWILTDARPSYNVWPKIQDYNDPLGDDSNDENSGYFYIPDNIIRPQTTTEALLDLLLKEYQQKRLSNNNDQINSNGYEKRKIKLKDYHRTQRRLNNAYDEYMRMI